jgi:hypothetical protein
MAHHSRDSIQRTFGGAPMTTGKGIAAARERIAAAFRALHYDQRTREERQADEQLRATIQSEPENPSDPNIVVCETEPQREYTEEKAQAFLIKGESLTQAALHSQVIRQHPTRKSTLVHKAFYAGDLDRPGLSADDLITEAMRHYEPRKEDK